MKYLDFLPPCIREKYHRLQNWNDKLLHAAGKILLLNGLHDLGYNDNCLYHLEYNQFGRPFLPGVVDFNISHSGKYALCAIGENIKLGIDIEEVLPVNLNDFEMVMATAEWDYIKKARDPLKKFFRLWTTKESIAKADSRGLTIPLESIKVFTNRSIGYFDGKIWFLRNLNLDNSYCTSLATDKYSDFIIFKKKLF